MCFSSEVLPLFRCSLTRSWINWACGAPMQCWLQLLHVIYLSHTFYSPHSFAFHAFLLHMFIHCINLARNIFLIPDDAAVMWGLNWNFVSSVPDDDKTVQWNIHNVCLLLNGEFCFGVYLTKSFFLLFSKKCPDNQGAHYVRVKTVSKKMTFFWWHGSSFLLFTKILQEIKKGSNRGGNLE